MKFRRQKIEEIQVNLTPLIDVVFLLLIFFMVTTTFKQTDELTIELPTAQSSQTSIQNQTRIDVLITADGQYSLNGRTLINEEVETLIQGIREVSEGNSDLPLIISADAKASYDLVLRVYDAAAQLGFAKLAHTTTREIRE